MLSSTSSADQSFEKFLKKYQQIIKKLSKSKLEPTVIFYRGIGFPRSQSKYLKKMETRNVYKRPENVFPKKYVAKPAMHMSPVLKFTY